VNEREEYLLYWLTLLSVRGLGIATVRILMERVPSYESGARLNVTDWQKIGAPARFCASIVTAFAKQSAHESVKRIMVSGVTYTSDRDAWYPVLLREISAAPPFLFYRGKWPESDRDYVAIVGTRTCSAYGRRAAFSFGKELAESGVIVVSGLAYGVDKAAHEGVLTGSGCTVAVLGSGTDCIYPREHANLAKQIINSGGCVMSEFLPWTSPRSHQFPQRNRIISGLCKAVVVLEAGRKSGALITADYALEQNREVLAMPGSIFSDRSEGTNDLIVAGATPLLSVLDILMAIGHTSLDGITVGRIAADRSYDACSKGALLLLRELSVLGRSLGELQQFVVTSGYDASEVFAWLTELEVGGMITRTNGMYTIAQSK